jgi:hypothetical protein
MSGHIGLLAAFKVTKFAVKFTLNFGGKSAFHSFLYISIPLNP